MSTLTTPSTAWQWLPDVIECARRYKVDAYLEPLRNALQEAFPMARSLKVFAETDPEIPDHYYIVFELRLPLVDVTDHVAARQRWDEVRRHICFPPGAYPFCLALLPENP